MDLIIINCNFLVWTKCFATTGRLLHETLYYKKPNGRCLFFLKQQGFIQFSQQLLALKQRKYVNVFVLTRSSNIHSSRTKRSFIYYALSMTCIFTCVYVSKVYTYNSQNKLQPLIKLMYSHCL